MIEVFKWMFTSLEFWVPVGFFAVMLWVGSWYDSHYD